jgi:hypothetical protein
MMTPRRRQRQQLLPGWVQTGQTDTSTYDVVLLTTDNGPSTLSIEADTGISPPGGAEWCDNPSQYEVGGKAGIMRSLCYYISVSWEGSDILQEMVHLDWWATNGSGTTAYSFGVETEADQDHFNAAYSAAVPVLQTVTWIAT